MNYRIITADGTRVSTLGLGGNIFGYACDEAETREIILTAENLGVNLVDTADVYSEGRSEELIGKALEGRRDRWIIATKVGVESGATGHGIAAKQVIFKRIEGSLRRLRTDYIDIYQLHHFDPVTPAAETIEAFKILRAQGKVRHFGLSNCTATQTDRYMAAAQAIGQPPPATHQIHYNLLKRQAEEEFLAAPDAQQPRHLIYGALGRGVLSGKYRAGGPPAQNTRAAMSVHVQADLQPAVLSAVAHLETLAHEIGLTMSQLAAAYVLRPPSVLAALIGIRIVTQLRELASGLDRPLRADQWARVDDFVQASTSLTEASLGQPTLSHS